MTSPRKEVRPSILKCLVTVFLHINYVPSQCYFRSSFLNSLLHSFNIFPHIFIPSTTILIFSLLNVINPSSTILFIFPPPPHFFCFLSTTTTTTNATFLLFSLHHHHRHISFVFPPPPPPPPPHFYCFPSKFGLLGMILASLAFRGKTIEMRRRWRRRRENNKNEEEEEEEGKQ